MTIPFFEAGNVYGRLKIIEIKYENRRSWAYCECSCGNKKRVRLSLLRSGHTKSCGCYQRDKSAERREKDLNIRKGDVFGRLTVKDVFKKRRRDGLMSSVAVCECSCGEVRTVAASSLKAGDSKSCGCLRRDLSSERARESLGILPLDRFGEWVVLELFEKPRKDGTGVRTFAKCRCSCGKEKEVDATSLKRGLSTSCGCKKGQKITKKKTRHGMTGSKIYNRWSKMIARCHNPREPNYTSYGGRGIEVCREWRESFDVYYEFAVKNGYRDDLEIDRIDNDGDYEPGNVRYVSRRTQGNNKRNNVILEHNGESLTAAQWGRKIGVSAWVIRERKRKGWTDEEALTTPVRKMSPRKKS